AEAGPEGCLGEADRRDHGPNGAREGPVSDKLARQRSSPVRPRLLSSAQRAFPQSRKSHLRGRRRMTPLANRYDIVFLFAVNNGNPHGDPDAGNLPRMDPETNIGLVRDVSLPRKIRNYTELARGDQPGYRIYVQEGSILNEKSREAYKAVRNGNERVAK